MCKTLKSYLLVFSVLVVLNQRNYKKKWNCATCAEKKVKKWFLTIVGDGECGDTDSYAFYRLQSYTARLGGRSCGDYVIN